MTAQKHSISNIELSKLKAKLEGVSLPEELSEKIADMLSRLDRLNQGSGYSKEFERATHYINWVADLPWKKQSTDTLNLSGAKNILDKNHYGLTEIKERILQYLSVIKLKQGKAQVDNKIHAPIICLVGLVGTGKTTLAYSIAQAMGRQLARIPFGGMGSARDLRGQSRLHLEAEPGHIIKSLRRVKVNNPVILLDEIDRVADEARADIMGVLVELLDPEQNSAFLDHYLDFPFNLSQVFFIATANNTTSIATAVMDRLEVLSMPSYTDKEKIAIAKDYLLPRELVRSGLNRDNLSIDEDLWPKVVRPLGFDAGIRTLARTIRGITLKLAKEVVEGKTSHLHLTTQNAKQYLPSY